ncbi:enoyl-CoA hydratase/isomerase family protein [Rhodococcus koreensis]
MSVLLEHTEGAITTLTINRPDAFNALNRDVLVAMASAVTRAADDPSSRAVILTASGTKAFSAGADLKELASMGPDTARSTLSLGQDVFRTIERAPIPVITAVNGLALGGGFELVLASTFPVLSEKVSLGLPEAALGLIPGYGGTQRLPRAVGERRAAHLMLTGSRIDADRAYEMGLTPVPPVAPGALLDTAHKVASVIAGQGPNAVRAIVRAIDIGRDAPLDAGLSAETGMAALAVAGEESTEGISAFLERRAPSFGESGEQE